MHTRSGDDDRAALKSLLHWYSAMGVDAAVGEEPCDRFSSGQDAAVAPREPSTPAPEAVPRRASPATTASADALVAQAEALAANANDLDALRASFETLPGCTLATTARMVFSGGTAGAPLMLIGAAPETDDERQGVIFAGASGRLLDAMLRAIGLDRTCVYFSHVVPWRPPGNRVPTSLELSLCLPFARRHIALARPRVILCLGERAAQPLLGTSDAISRLRGRWLSFEGETNTTKLLATFSPSYLLNQPLQKRRAWADLQMVSAALEETGA
jgi:DNA polymerase